MTATLLRAQSNERVDLDDFTYLADTGLQELGRQVPGNFLTNPSGQRAWIVSGFAPSNPAGAQLQVDRGVAILSQRENSVVEHGVLTTEGDANKNIDMSAFADATYGVYVRFELVEGDSASRIFWNAAGLGSETTQTIPTRRLANWSLRIETSSPGGEWFQIASVVKTGGSITITDTRSFYFEGDVANSYASAWGTGNDRDDDRATYGVTSLQDFNAAMRFTLTEMKGSAWWRQSISGNTLPDILQFGDYFTDTVVSGFAYSPGGGLVADFAAGVCYTNGKRVETTATLQITIPDNSDTYVDVLEDGTLDLNTVPTGNPAPALTGVRLWRLDALAGSISTNTDLRNHDLIATANTNGDEVFQFQTSDAYIKLDPSIFELNAAAPLFQITEGGNVWFQGLDSDEMFWSFDSSAAANRTLRSTTEGVGVFGVPDTNHTFVVHDEGGDERFKVSGDNTSPNFSYAIIKAGSATGAGVLDFTSDADALRWRLIGGDPADSQDFEFAQGVVGSVGRITYANRHLIWSASSIGAGANQRVGIGGPLILSPASMSDVQGLYVSASLADNTLATPVVRFGRGTGTADGVIDFAISATQARIGTRSSDCRIGALDANDVDIITSAVPRFSIQSDGRIGTGNEDNPDVEAGGITIMQTVIPVSPTATTSNISTIKNTSGSIFAHGFTDYAESDTYHQGRIYSSSGGVTNRFFANGGVAASFEAHASSPNGAFQFDAYKTDGGTGRAALLGTENMAQFRNATSAAVSIRGDGTITASGDVKAGTGNAFFVGTTAGYSGTITSGFTNITVLGGIITATT